MMKCLLMAKAVLMGLLLALPLCAEEVDVAPAPVADVVAAAEALPVVDEPAVVEDVTTPSAAVEAAAWVAEPSPEADVAQAVIQQGAAQQEVLQVAELSVAAPAAGKELAANKKPVENKEPVVNKELATLNEPAAAKEALAEPGLSTESPGEALDSATDIQALAQAADSSEVDASLPEADYPLGTKIILDSVVTPNSYVRLTWNSDVAVGGFSEATPVLVVNGATPGNTLCLVGAVHGDELNGIEMIRRVIFDIDPSKLTGTIIGVPVANIMGFRRNSRYLPDRRDWNRYFPGNTHGSSASRLAHSFFTRVIAHCDSLVDLHTGSFHRSNFPQLRADLSDESVAALAQNFGDIAVLNGRGNANSLRAAAVRAGIPAVTMEAGEPMTMQRDIVSAGVRAIQTMLAKTGMYGKPPSRWNRIAPVYYRSVWVRANQSGILFSNTTLGKRVKEGELLGTVTDPVTNARTRILAPFDGRVLGMALDQVVLPGFAAYHIGIQTPESILIEQSQQAELSAGELDDEDGDDAGVTVEEAVRETPANQ